MRIKDPIRRLDKFWGKVDLKHIQLIKNKIQGFSVLDLGCGFGTTTNILTLAGYNCIGIDFDPETINKASDRFPYCTFIIANAEELPFESNCFDTIVLRDSLHHFFQDSDFIKVCSEIKRVSKINSRLVILDPNINFLVKTMRKIISHHDAECDYSTALKVVEKMEFKLTDSSFNTVFSLPLSGGYVGLNFIPDISIVHTLILKTEQIFEYIFNYIGIGRHVCWRYLIIADKN